MITHLQIRRWRAYRELDLVLGPGITFIVAANGVGKSSLLEAAAWGIFGEASGIDPGSAISAGHDSAEVALSLATSSGDIQIRRSIDRNNHVELELVHPVQGPMRDGGQIARVVEDAMGARLALAARLTFLTDKGDLSPALGEFPLKEHLAATFGIHDLMVAAHEAESHRKAAERDRKKLRSAASAGEQELTRARQELEAIEQQLADAERVQAEARDRLAMAQSQLREAQGWADYRTEFTRREEQLAKLIRDIQGLSEFEDVEGVEREPERALTQAEDAVNEQLNKTLASAASDTARAEAASTAIRDLSSAEGTCPTCLRPLGDTDVSEAIAKHESHHRDLQAAVESSRALVSTLEDRLARLRALERRLALLPTLRELPDTPEIGVDEASAKVSTTQDEVNSAVGTVEKLRIRRQQLGDTIETATEASRVRRAPLIAFRREAIAEAAHLTLARMADLAMSTSIGPLTEEVAHRWKRLFGTGEGLQLHPDGSITMERNGQTLNFSDLSGGEQVSSLLVTRLLVLTASTTARFAWLDEPLEHLDPIRRHTMAATLAKAAESRHLDQVLVTTFEEGIARRLAAARPSVSLEYVRTAG